MNYNEIRQEFVEALENNVLLGESITTVEERISAIGYKGFIFYVLDPLQGFYTLVPIEDIKSEWSIKVNAHIRTISYDRDKKEINVKRNKDGEFPILEMLSLIRDLQDSGNVISDITSFGIDVEEIKIRFKPAD